MPKEIRTSSRHQCSCEHGLPPTKATAVVKVIVTLVVMAGLMGSMSGYAQEEAPATVPGLHKRVLQPRERRYTIAIPKDYDGQKPVPLILALHFSGPVTPHFGGRFLEAFVHPALERLGAIMVAPDCTDTDWTRPRSEKDLLELLDFLMKHYAIDKKRTLITGYSMGGIGTWFLAARHQDLFSAALIMAGSPQSSTAKTDWKIPLYVIHSRADEIVPFDPTAKVVEKLRGRGISIQFAPIDGVTHYQVERFFEPLQAAVPWIEKVWQQDFFVDRNVKSIEKIEILNAK